MSDRGVRLEANKTAGAADMAQIEPCTVRQPVLYEQGSVRPLHVYTRPDTRRVVAASIE